MIIASFHLIVVGILTLARPTNFATPQRSSKRGLDSSSRFNCSISLRLSSI